MFIFHGPFTEDLPRNQTIIPDAEITPMNLHTNTYKLSIGVVVFFAIVTIIDYHAKI